MSVIFHHADSREVLKGFAENSIDSVVCDPPYALVSIVKRFGADGAAAPKSEGATGVYKRASAGFMGKTWDNGKTAFDPAFWAEVLRVMKPGAHLVAFSGTRTYHRLACAIEDAGFEIRDLIADLVSADEPVRSFMNSLTDAQRSAFIRCIDESQFGGMLAWVFGSGFPKSHNLKGDWKGWGTALKPGFEPILLARKTLDGTVMANVLKHGTGAINIDGCRVGGGDGGSRNGEASANQRYSARGSTDFSATPGPRGGAAAGRWPANVVHDGSPEVILAFPQAPGQQRSVTGEERAHRTLNAYGDFGRSDGGFEPRGDTGSAARFFYSAKADAEDRLGSKHPTVKPIDLMAWLCRLVTPPGGVVLDPFAGTGTTGLAAMREGFDCILIEREAEYVADIKRRLAWARGEGRLTAQECARDVEADFAELPMFSGVGP